jgi:hypothetical protein
MLLAVACRSVGSSGAVWQKTMACVSCHESLNLLRKQTLTLLDADNVDSWS